MNEGVKACKGSMLFTSHDHEFVQTIANRIFEIRLQGLLDKRMDYDEFLERHAEFD